MNSFVRKSALSLCIALCAVTAAQAQELPNSTSGSGANSNPYNSPIHRANPNSRQGTQPVTPPGRTQITPPTTRTPTLENRGIGDGYPNGQTPRSTTNEIRPAPRTN